MPAQKSEIHKDDYIMECSELILIENYLTRISDVHLCINTTVENASTYTQSHSDDTVRYVMT